jgi:hypothetical protein
MDNIMILAEKLLTLRKSMESNRHDFVVRGDSKYHTSIIWHWSENDDFTAAEK